MINLGNFSPRSALPRGIGKNGPGISVWPGGASLTPGPRWRKGRLAGAGGGGGGAVGHSVLRTLFPL